MWCDWSNSTHEVRQAFCSVRQLVNSGATGKACGRAVDWRSSSTGDPARRDRGLQILGSHVLQKPPTAGPGFGARSWRETSRAAASSTPETRAPRIGQAVSLDRDKCLVPACRPVLVPRDNGRMTERLEVQRAVAAPAGEIFAVLSDPRGHVAIDSSGMLMEASGDVVAKVGDTFVVHMDREALNDYPLGLYDVTVEIVTFEPGREIAWTVRGQLNLGHVYGYRLEPIDGGHARDVLLRLVGGRAELEGRRDLPGDPRERAAGHARDPGPHRRPRQAPPGGPGLMRGRGGIPGHRPCAARRPGKIGRW